MRRRKKSWQIFFHRFCKRKEECVLNKISYEQLGKDVGQYIGTGIAGALEDASVEATETFKGFYERLKYQRDFNLISEAEFYLRLELLRDKYLKKGTDSWAKYTLEIYEYQQKVIKEEQKAYEENLKAIQKRLEEEEKAEQKRIEDERKAAEKLQREEEKRLKAELKLKKQLIEQEKKDIKSLYDEVTEYAIEKLEQILKKQQRLAQNLNSYGSFYNVNTVHMNGFTDQYYSLHDLSADIEAIERYSNDLKELKERAVTLGISTDASDYLLGNIKEMNTEEALLFMDALLRADDNMFSVYFEKAHEKYRLSEDVSANAYEEEFKKGIEDSYTNMMDLLEQAGYDIPEGFAVSGSISAQKFGEAFILELDNQLGLIRGIIDEFNSEIDISAQTGGDTYNTSNTAYNITTPDPMDTVEYIKRMETMKRLSGVK